MKTIYLLAIFLVLNTFMLSAQIVYTDINPDVNTTLTPPNSVVNVISIDFNGDGTKEYDFRWDDYSSGLFEDWYMHMTFESTNEFNLRGDATDVNPYGGRYIQPMTSGTVINASLNWGNSTTEPFIGDSNDQNFQGLGDRYVGCRFTLGANSYYGWVRVSFANKKLIIKDYAYESTADKAINAGDTETLGVQTLNFEAYFNCFPIPAINTLTIENKTGMQINKMDIVNLEGQRLVSKTNVNDRNITIDVSSFKTGVYFLHLTTAHTSFSKKIIVE